jgi:hypothetical protein
MSVRCGPSQGDWNVFVGTIRTQWSGSGPFIADEGFLLIELVVAVSIRTAQTLPIVNTVLVDQIRVLSSQRRGEARAVMAVEVLLNLLAGIVFDQGQESSVADIRERAVALPAPVFEGAHRTFPAVLRVSWWKRPRLSVLCVRGRPLEHALEERRAERLFEHPNVHRGSAAVDDHGVLYPAVVLLRETVHVGVDLRSVMVVRLVEVINRGFGFHLGDQQRLALAINDHWIGRSLETEFFVVGCRDGIIDPHRVPDVRVLARDRVLEVRNDDILLEALPEPEDAFRWLALFGSVGLAVGDFSVTLEEVAWRVPFGLGNGRGAVEVRFSLSDVLGELAFGVPLREALGTDPLRESGRALTTGHPLRLPEFSAMGEPRSYSDSCHQYAGRRRTYSWARDFRFRVCTLRVSALPSHETGR